MKTNYEIKKLLVHVKKNYEKDEEHAKFLFNTLTDEEQKIAIEILINQMPIKRIINTLWKLNH